MYSLETFLRGGRFKHLIDIRLASLCDEFNLKRLEAELIYYLSDCEDKNTASDIRTVLYVNKGHLSCMLSELCERGFITCRQDMNDKRYNHYELTDKAQSVWERMGDEWRNIMNQVLDGVTDEEKETYVRLAQKLRDNIDKMLEEKE